MMEPISQAHVYCACKYKCAESEDGYKMIPETTRRRHYLKDKKGEIFQYPIPINSASIPESGAHAFPVEYGEGTPNTDPISNSRLAKCICRLCGESGQMIPRVTQRRHMSIKTWTQRLRVRERAFAAVEEVTLGEDLTMEGVEYEYVRDESELDDTEVPTADRAQDNEEDEAQNNGSRLDDAILETVIELFSVLDHHKVSIACQEKVLKILYRGISKDAQVSTTFSDNPTSYRGLSLARLYTLAGPHWKGGINGMAAPKTWNRLMEIYKMNGMVVPEKWLICTGEVGKGHAPAVFHFEDANQTCLVENCKMEKSNMCAFSYLPLAKIFTSLFESQTFCDEVLQLWRNRSGWLHTEDEEAVEPLHIDEFWHGKKFLDYSKFWDPSSTWKLPLICPNVNCGKAYRLWPSVCDELDAEENFDKRTGHYHFPCVDCAAEIHQQPHSVKGSPFNIALMGHWDGFQAATTVQKDCWTVEVVILNGGKRPLPNSKIAKPIPLLFIPMSSVLLEKKKEYHLLQAFLKPLWADFRESFVDGFPVKLKHPNWHSVTPDERDEDVIVRVMTMMWTGDGPAQSKIGGGLLMGYNGCRRDFLHSESIASTTGSGKRKVVYSQNRKQARLPPNKRDVEAMHHYGKCLRESVTKDQRSENKIQSGLSHFSDMWILYDLHGFDIARDLVHDPMHTLALGVFKSYNDKLLLSCNAMEVKKLIKVLQTVTRNRPIGLGARWPHPPLYVKNVSGTGSKWKLSNYKAEEHLLFMMFCVEPILEELGHTVGTPLGAEGAILIHLSRLFFLVSRTHGWTSEMLENARLHFSAWRVLTEETYGPNGRIVEHVIGNGEILDDIKRHGHHDIFWCYGFERMVSAYNSISTNRKSSELSFAQYFCRQLFSESFSQLQRDKDGLRQEERTLHMLQTSLYPRIVGHSVEPLQQCATYHNKKVIVVTSIEKATQLWNLVQFMGKFDLPFVQAAAKGLAIGPYEGFEVQIPLDGKIASSLRSYWLDTFLLSPRNEGSFRYRIENIRGVLVNGVHYRKNDRVVVQNSNKDMPSLKCKIELFFLHGFDSHWQLFFCALPYTEVSTEADCEGGQLYKSECTGMNLLFDEPSSQSCEMEVYPVSRLLHRFMSHPTKLKPGGKKAIVAFELQDIIPRTHLLAPGRPGCCPPWPMCHDVAVVSLTPGEKNSPLYLVYIIKVHSDDNAVAENSERGVEIVWLVADHSSAHEIRDHEIFRVKSGHEVCTLIWENVLAILDPTLFQKMELRGSKIQRWKAPENWTCSLFLERYQIKSPPPQQGTHENLQSVTGN